MFDARKAYKPFKYPWAADVTKKQQQMHWLPEEVPMAKDMKDWATMPAHEISLAKNIMFLFTQSDCDVLEGYLGHYLVRFKNPEIKHMLITIAAQEVIHVLAYSYLMETLGMGDEEYAEFLSIKEMADKHDATQHMKSNTDYQLAVTMARFAGFVEGMQLFASFIMLLNFQRFGKLKGMGQIVAWSVRDETLHSAAITRLCNQLVRETFDECQVEDFKEEVIGHCKDAVALEDAFIDKAFEMGPVQGLTAEDVKLFIRHIADRRLEAFGIEPIYGVKENPQPWFDEVIGGVEHANFFESRATAYSKAATAGEDWFE